MIYKNKTFAKNELRGEHFSDCEFLDCLFPNSDFKFTVFTRCKFHKCDLSSIQCNNTNFSECIFPESKLSNLNFFSLKFEKCDFAGAVMKDCIFKQSSLKINSSRKKFLLNSCNFSDTDLTSSIFNFCNLSGVDFRNSKLEKVTFEKCDLQKADFSNAFISGASFIDCKIENTVLDLQGFINFGNSKGFVLGN